MPIINILQIGTQGVDMKTHPLFLGNKKLHAATNLAFEEGKIRTRPGVNYHALGVSGQFQGACLFTPSLGISSQSFADPLAGLVTSAGGKVYINDTWGRISCHPLEIACSEDFACRGEVNIFPAENYLVIQNQASNTHWWTGDGAATPSPGMAGDQYWLDPEPQRMCFSPQEIVANIPECDRFPCEFDACVLAITDIEVTAPDTAVFTIFNSGTAQATIDSFSATPAEGVTFDPPSLTIEAGVGQEVTVSSPDHDLEQFGLGVSIANSCGSGTLAFTVPPPSPPVLPCELTVLSLTTINESLAFLVLQNTGQAAITSIQLDPVGSGEWSYNPLLPLDLASGATIAIQISGLGSDIQGMPFSILSSCDPINTEIPVITGPACDLDVESGTFDVEYSESGSFTVINTGTTNVTITDVVSAATGFVFTDATELPITLIPGESRLCVVLTPGSQIIGIEITVENSCMDQSFFLQNPP